MKRLEYEFKGRGNAGQPGACVLAGVVGSGNLEVLMESRPDSGVCRVVVETSVTGFDETWAKVLEAFFERHALNDLEISINDAGATPAVVNLRLEQAVAKLRDAGGTS